MSDTEYSNEQRKEIQRKIEREIAKLERQNYFHKNMSDPEMVKRIMQIVEENVK
ncbi:hypothetical protein MOZ60_01970 [Stecheria sp. CLA-KB-P133]|uniref:Uncharacterized protein n=1 Tax=Grylomicrobium aquisgranensis TaxID=2926318 RepID=A0AB35TZV7_9FIRM|nr:hypothetical protein [Lactimicrobium massiliense]MDD6560146.1 hypothetical protein [Lactimicrobium massiliense]MDX8418857.1 hypothetical protein [Stecheria sp. CLA-KB-P133]MDY3931349.1 hypothetical protein [Erysipelotrichaceae bacterium]